MTDQVLTPDTLKTGDIASAVAHLKERYPDAVQDDTRQGYAGVVIDKNHLVMDGRSLHGVPKWSLDDPNVDIVTTHHYPGAKPIPAAVRECIADAAREKTSFRPWRWPVNREGPQLSPQLGWK